MEFALSFSGKRRASFLNMPVQRKGDVGTCAAGQTLRRTLDPHAIRRLSQHSHFRERVEFYFNLLFAKEEFGPCSTWGSTGHLPHV